MSNKNTNKTKQDYNNNKKENACLVVKDSNLVLETSEMMQLYRLQCFETFFYYVSEKRAVPLRNFRKPGQECHECGTIKEGIFQFQICLNCVYNCDDQSCLLPSYVSPKFKDMIFHIFICIKKEYIPKHVMFLENRCF